MAVLCLPWLRWKHPEWERPIKVNLIWPILYVLATIFITVVPMIASPVETGKSELVVNVKRIYYADSFIKVLALE